MTQQNRYMHIVSFPACGLHVIVLYEPDLQSLRDRVLAGSFQDNSGKHLSLVKLIKQIKGLSKQQNTSFYRKEKKKKWCSFFCEQFRMLS